MIRKIFYLVVSGTLIISCNNQVDKHTYPPRKEQIKIVASEYFKTFAKREDWNKLVSFYAEDVEFEDINLQIRLDSLWQFERFYNWEGDDFQKLTPDQDHLTVYSLITDDTTAVVRGRFNPFYYHGDLVDVEWGMEFSIWLYFNEDLKIQKQIDWIEYDPSIINGVIDHYRSQGIDKIPEWLDLSRE